MITVNSFTIVCISAVPFKVEMYEDLRTIKYMASVK